ncbi:unnamed protein product [Penicillium salamii]|uniref:Major facilitator superfamily (MFS) profile domain-containing protein n=1 Tax=Penicillium salamii TaxID=1612424 RepID=A0A9W4JPA5_9EURO|nr:unnamed protein product [Penicillium salamii]CAG8219334.1 unnamed protein product [Penicillium salamii]CAG8261252.1 unnamed protein product [Penicillium salamii]CAG8328062.1 unnamed protein product [Penicillium salamii]CAG8386307.1 unnamed protein product [Penicillium salamii]
MSATDEKGSVHSHQIEDLEGEKARSRNGHSPMMPASLAALSEVEYSKVKRRALWKLDARIMPCMVLMYIMNYLDRQNIASAKLANIEQDLKMTDVQYQTCISILFVGYILMQVPSNLIVGKIKFPGVYICVSMALWGVLSACTAAVHNFSGLLASRFFLGFVEAVFFPGALFYLSLFYSKKQFALRTAILYSGSQLGNAFGGLLAVAILKLDDVHGLEGWRWLFLVEGVATIGLAIILVFILPDSLKSISGFSKIEHEFLMWNFEEDQGQQDNADEVSARKGFIMAVVDVKTWLLMGILYSVGYPYGRLFMFLTHVFTDLYCGRRHQFFPIGCGYTWIFSKQNLWTHCERYWHIVCPMAICMVANIIAVATLNTAARYVAMMLMPGSFYSAAVVVLSWVTGSLSQPSIKRASAIALINAICNTPNVWASYLYYSSPRYLAAFLVNLASSVLAIILATLTRMYLQRQNDKLDRGLYISGKGPTPAQVAAGFRYVI